MVQAGLGRVLLRYGVCHVRLRPVDGIRVGALQQLVQCRLRHGHIVISRRQGALIAAAGVLVVGDLGALLRCLRLRQLRLRGGDLRLGDALLRLAQVARRAPHVSLRRLHAGLRGGDLFRPGPGAQIIQVGLGAGQVRVGGGDVRGGGGFLQRRQVGFLNTQVLFRRRDV